MNRSKLEQSVLWSLLTVITTLGNVTGAQDDIEDPSIYPGSWYRIVFDSDGEYVTGDGHGYGSGTWYYYPESGVWRQWFYNDPYDPDRRGYLNYEVYIKAFDPDRPTYAEVYFNWTTPEWSERGLKRPPLPEDVPTINEEFEYMSSRRLYLVDNWYIGTIEPIASHTVEAYNPEWVSIDIQARNAYIYRGVMRECQAKEGACCHQVTEECFMAVQLDCPPPYLWLGPDSSCVECTGQVVWLDFGDAPNSDYKTYAASDGARHTLVQGVHLGNTVDGEPEGRPGSNADGDDSHGEDDEDGVVFVTPLSAGALATIEVTASTRGYLNAWIDFDQDGRFHEDDEHVFDDTPLATGPNPLSFEIPAKAAKGKTFARFRFNTRGLLTSRGLALDGEVEDYSVSISAPGYEPQPHVGRGTPKWSQPPMRVDPGTPEVFDGWSESSALHVHQIVADDWQCSNDRPITGFQWWGAFEGWTEPLLPSQTPLAFHIAIWTDMPDPKGSAISGHPAQLIWETYCTDWTWNVAGCTSDPRHVSPEETCFQFAGLLSQDQWFLPPDESSMPHVYWLSIAAIYDTEIAPPQHSWGWATRPLAFGAGAVRISETSRADAPEPAWPPSIASQVITAGPIRYPDSVSWDMAFELLSNQRPGAVDAGLAPVYRFWSDKLSAHFYTISETEKDKLIEKYADTWRYEGIAFYAYPPECQVAGTLPVYRFWSANLGRHFYSMSETEKDKLIEKYPHVWAFEGIAWHAFDQL